MQVTVPSLHFQMNYLLIITILVSLGLARSEAGPEGSNYQLLSLIDQANPQGPHFRPLNGLGSLKPTAKSFQVQWRPSFYSGISTFQDSQVTRICPIKTFMRHSKN